MRRKSERPRAALHSQRLRAAWGRTPVYATVDGKGWKTSVWRDKKQGTLLPIPKAIRGDKGDGDRVTVELRLQAPISDRG